MHINLLTESLVHWLDLAVNTPVRDQERPALNIGAAGQLKDGTAADREAYEETEEQAQDLEDAQDGELTDDLEDAVSGDGVDVSGGGESADEGVSASGDSLSDAVDEGSGGSVPAVSGDALFADTAEGLVEGTLTAIEGASGDAFGDFISGDGIDASGDGLDVSGDGIDASGGADAVFDDGFPYGYGHYPRINVYDGFVPSADSDESHFPYISVIAKSGTVVQGQASVDVTLELGTYSSDPAEGRKLLVNFVNRVQGALFSLENGILERTFTLEGEVSWEIKDEAEPFYGASFSLVFAYRQPFHPYPVLKERLFNGH